MFHTQEEINKKLEILHKNIQEKGKKAEQIRDLLRILAGFERGQDIIMQMPNYTYFIMEKASSMEHKGRAGFFSPEMDAVILRDTIINGEKEKKFEAINLAHEMRHAIQFANGLLEFKTPG